MADIEVGKSVWVRVGFVAARLVEGVIEKIEQEGGKTFIDFRDNQGQAHWCYPEQVLGEAA